jgi:hypothetical protein
MDNTHEDSIDSIAYCFWNREESHIYDTILDAISRAKNNPDSKIYITEDLFIQFRDLMRKQDFLEKYKNETNLRFGINNTVIHYNQDLLPFKIKYLISYDLLRKNINIMPVLDEKITKETNLQNISIGNINKEEKDMLKILEIYKEKKTREIEHKYDEQLLELECNDPVNTLVKETEEKLKEMLNSDNVLLVLNSDTMEFTQETIEKRKKIIDIIHQEKKELNDVIKEIESLLELAPNYEEKLQILRDYGIIDKKKNIVL